MTRIDFKKFKMELNEPQEFYIGIINLAKKILQQKADKKTFSKNLCKIAEGKVFVLIYAISKVNHEWIASDGESIFHTQQSLTSPGLRKNFQKISIKGLNNIVSWEMIWTVQRLALKYK